MARFLIHPRGSAFRLNLEAPGRVAPQRDFRTVHLEDARVAAGRAGARHDSRTGKKTEFHQAAGVLGRKIDSLDHRGVTAAQIHKGWHDALHGPVIDTQLQHNSSMGASEIVVKRGAANGDGG